MDVIDDKRVRQTAEDEDRLVSIRTYFLAFIGTYTLGDRGLLTKCIPKRSICGSM